MALKREHTYVKKMKVRCIKIPGVSVYMQRARKARARYIERERIYEKVRRRRRIRYIERRIERDVARERRACVCVFVCVYVCVCVRRWQREKEREREQSRVWQNDYITSLARRRLVAKKEGHSEKPHRADALTCRNVKGREWAICEREWHAKRIEFVNESVTAARRSEDHVLQMYEFN